MILDQLQVPVVLAPLAGGPSTPALAAAVSGAGGLGFLASGYLSARELEERINVTRELGAAPLGVNLFAPGAPADASDYRAYVRRLEDWAQRLRVELGPPRYSDDDWHAKLELLAAQPVDIVSFTFGCLGSEVIDALHAVGSEIWVTVTSPREARQAADAGADVLVVQGAEAGGHRGSFQDTPDLPVFGLLALLDLVSASVSLPLVASGAIATGNALAAVLAAGASAGQVGTAFMLSPEAGTTAVHRAALRTPETTVLTRAFTGRLARGIRNGFIAEHEAHAALAYPELHYVTAPMRKRGREEGDADLVNLWAGEAHELAQERPAAEIVHSLAAGARAALASAADLEALRSRGVPPPSGAERALGTPSLRHLVGAWYEAWNTRDLDRVLSHYSEDVTFSSPFIAAVGADASGTLVGKPSLRAFWARVLERYPELRLEPICALFGVGSVTLHYHGVAGVLGAEVLEVDSDGLIFRGAVHYDRMP